MSAKKGIKGGAKTRPAKRISRAAPPGHEEVLANPDLLLTNAEKPPGKNWLQLLFHR